jgi:transcriptional regulator with XRE-family HTH domain
MAVAVELFRAFRVRHGLSQRAAASALGVSGPTVCEWEKQRKRPDAHHRAAIEIWTNGAVPARAWLTAAEARVLRVVRPYVAA